MLYNLTDNQLVTKVLSDNNVNNAEMDRFERILQGKGRKMRSELDFDCNGKSCTSCKRADYCQL